MINTNKRKVNLLTLTLITFFTLLFCLSFSAKAQTAKSVEELVKSISKGKLKVETRAKPYKLEADFNGDKIEDAAVIVELLDLPKNIDPKIKKAFPYYMKTVSKNDLAMLIIHGAGKGWRFAQKSSVLFLGRNSALIFEKSRLGEYGENGGNWEIEKRKRGKVRLFFSTEGSEGYLKWNGKKYIWWETNP